MQETDVNTLTARIICHLSELLTKSVSMGYLLLIICYTYGHLSELLTKSVSTGYLLLIMCHTKGCSLSFHSHANSKIIPREWLEGDLSVINGSVSGK